MTPESFHDVFHVVYPDPEGGVVYSGYTLAHPGSLGESAACAVVFGHDLAGFLQMARLWEMRALGLDPRTDEEPDHVRRFEIRSHGWMAAHHDGWLPVLERDAARAVKDEHGRTWNRG